MKKYKRYVIGGAFACLMAVALMMPIEKTEAFWPFGKAKTENNINYTGAVANVKGGSKIATSTITVISPNGGETLKGGKNFNIKWKSKGLSKKEKVSIFLDEEYEGFGGSYLIATTTNNGFYKWFVPKDKQGGNIFKVRLYVGVPYDIIAEDKSDGFFTITGKTVKINIPPKIGEWEVIGSSGGDIKVGETVSLNAKAFDADNDDLIWGVDWGDGSGMKSGACEVDHKQNRKGWDFNTKHEWKEKGTYTIGLEVSDCRSGSDKSATSINIESI